jgi:type IV pilus assembly protein PilW
MSTKFSHRTPVAPTQRGFTLVELMVTVGIALFLLGGLVTIMQNVRSSNITQTNLTALQDQERFALTVLTDAIQVAGYVADPTAHSSADFGAVGLFPQGAAITGSHFPLGVVPPATAVDTVQVRFWTNQASTTTWGTGPIICNGSDLSVAADAVYTVAFSVDPNNDLLQCSVNNGPLITLVPKVHAMEVYYGVNRLAPGADYNIDTWVTADNLMNPSDFLNVSAVRIILSFDNPNYVIGGTQPPYVTIERVIQIMSRAGVVT